VSLFAGISGLGGVLQGAAGLVQALKQPRVSGAQFAAVLNQQLAKSQGPAYAGAPAADPTAALRTHAAALSGKFVSLRDANGDAQLQVGESGLDPARFAKLDVNQDGKLSELELRAYAIANYAEAAQVLK
jgi:hypothetical protein